MRKRAVVAVMQGNSRMDIFPADTSVVDSSVAGSSVVGSSVEGIVCVDSSQAECNSRVRMHSLPEADIAVLAALAAWVA